MEQIKVERNTVKHILIIALALCMTTLPVAANISNEDLSSEPEVQAEQIEAIITDVFADMGPTVVKTMVDIARCESELLHVEHDGSLVQNSNSSASGVFQILLYTHGQEIERLNLDLDLTDLTEHVQYARFLVEDSIRAGHPPFIDWQPSVRCWG